MILSIRGTGCLVCRKVFRCVCVCVLPADFIRNFKVGQQDWLELRHNDVLGLDLFLPFEKRFAECDQTHRDP